RVHTARQAGQHWPYAQRQGRSGRQRRAQLLPATGAGYGNRQHSTKELLVSPRLALVVLAAGHGTRMRSSLPKPVHPIAGLPMVEHVLRAGAAANPAITILVVNPGTANLVDRINTALPITTVVQDPPRGTGDAVRLAMAAC